MNAFILIIILIFLFPFTSRANVDSAKLRCIESGRSPVIFGELYDNTVTLRYIQNDGTFKTEVLRESDDSELSITNVALDGEEIFLIQNIVYSGDIFSSSVKALICYLRL